MALLLVSLSRSAGAFDRRWCDDPNLKLQNQTWTDALNDAKRLFWQRFPPDEARKRSHDAYIAAFENVRINIDNCCLPGATAEKAQTCRNEIVRADAEIRQWDWRSPPE
jgi:hypothetical protein